MSKGDCERTDRGAKGVLLSKTLFIVRSISRETTFSPPLMFNFAPLSDLVNCHSTRSSRSRGKGGSRSPQNRAETGRRLRRS